MANKKTNKEFFAEVIALAGANKELADWASKQIEALNKKAENRKPTKTQVDNEAFKSNILAYLTVADKPVTATEILNKTELPSIQKVSALLKIMVEKDGTVEKVVDKKKSYFSVKSAENDTDVIEEAEDE